ncbi:YARHG domain-containing protein [Microcoleus sp. FACHB-68]|uniref:YARHG domain-containing protein n=1 Tax=Microcoleus sp. FACHB-68 TaxID=2692826 RepID=UPI00168553C8|nr:YARHG domain-containing protein [Microcoleus sp. FACHB-68]MBD1936792.1 YARHG domain-containing protein [Microcoleus sp. FACHB-68]
MGRYVLNQSFGTIEGYFGKPLVDREVIVNYPIKGLQKFFPDFPADGEFRIAFVNGKAQRIEVAPELPPKLLFEYIFGYPAPVEIIFVEWIITGGHQTTICLGDGIRAEIMLTGAGGVANYTNLYYDEEFVRPYDVLRGQTIVYNSQWTDYLAASVKEAEYPWLSQRQVTEKDLIDTDWVKRYVMKTSIYARKGLIFCHPLAKAIFTKQQWYRPIYRTHEFGARLNNLLNAVEKYNFNFLSR